MGIRLPIEEAAKQGWIHYSLRLNNKREIHGELLKAGKKSLHDDVER